MKIWKFLENLEIFTRCVKMKIIKDGTKNFWFLWTHPSFLDIFQKTMLTTFFQKFYPLEIFFLITTTITRKKIDGRKWLTWFFFSGNLIFSDLNIKKMNPMLIPVSFTLRRKKSILAIFWKKKSIFFFGNLIF